jgi:Bor protein
MKKSLRISTAAVLLLFISECMLTSCYSYKIATHAQEGSEFQKDTIDSYFWGIMSKPAKLTTTLCDSLKTPGISELKVHRTFGNSLVTVLTLGIYSRVIVEYKCSKNCTKCPETL